MVQLLRQGGRNPRLRRGDSLNAFVDAIRRTGIEWIHVTVAQMTGFALAATGVVLSGGVVRMLELARSNLPNIPGALAR